MQMDSFEFHGENDKKTEFLMNEKQSSHYLTPGTVLKGHMEHEFCIEKVIGETGQSIIYLARETPLERRVVISEYFPALIAVRDTETQEVKIFSSGNTEAFHKGLTNFMIEIEKESLLSGCSGVREIYDYFVYNGTGYISSEYIVGQDLKNYVKNLKVKMGENEIRDFSWKLLSCLTEIHRRGVIHCNLSPNSIYITSEKEIKILGFECAFYKKHKVKEADFITTGFSAPEQYHVTHAPDNRTDIYAVGTIMFWLCTGKVPSEAIERQQRDSLSDVLVENNISQHFIKVIGKAISLEPKKRYKSAEKFIEDLQERKRKLFHFGGSNNAKKML